MAQLDERTRSDLVRLRMRESPSAAAKQRMLAGLELQLGGGSDGADDPSGSHEPSSAGGPGPGGSAQLGFAVKVVGATLGLSAAGLLVVAVAAAGMRAGSGLRESPRSQSFDQSAPTSLAGPPPNQGLDVARSNAEPPATPAEPAASAIEQSERRRRRSTFDPDASPSATATTDTLAEELALLEAAHASADASAALVVLERHLTEFPEGSLAVERELLRVEALCRLDRLADAQALADRVFLGHPNAASRSRLASACPRLNAPILDK